MSKKENMTGGYSLCMNEWALDKSIKNELGLLLIISSLTAETGYCYASNPHLAKLFDIDDTSVSRKIKKLINKGYLTAEYEKRGAQVIKRKLRLAKMSIDGYQKCQSTISKNVKENNTSINNTSNNKKSVDKSTAPINYEELKRFYNENNNNMSDVRVLTDKRKKQLRARINDDGVETFKEAVKKAAESDFLNGKNDRGWKADFEFIVNPNKFNKILEGAYDNHTRPGYEKLDEETKNEWI